MKETFSDGCAPKVPTLRQALIHHTTGYGRKWKDLRGESQVTEETYTWFLRSMQDWSPTVTGSHHIHKR